MEDPRRAFVIDTVANALHADKETARSVVKADENGAVTAFVDAATTTVLQAKLYGDGTVKCTNTVSYDDGATFSVLITKTNVRALELSDIPKNVVVSTVTSTPLSSLYHSLKSVYQPLITANPDALNNPKLQGLLSELEAGIGQLLRRGAGLVADPAQMAQQYTEPNEASLLAILTPSDEFQMWAELAGASGAPPKIVERAQEVYECFEPIRRQFDDMHMQGEEAVLELVDVTHDALEKVWELQAQSADGWAYGQKRMEHLLHIIGEAFLGYLQHQMAGVNIWVGPFKTVETGLRFGLRLIARWERVQADLTQLTWPRHRHTWSGGAFVDKSLVDTRGRIDEVLKMREMNSELGKLMSEEEVKTLALNTVFTPFLHLNPLRTSQYTEPLWKAAKDEYEKRMVPIETRISQKMRELFGSVLIPSLAATVSKHGDRGSTALAEAHQVFNELQRYGELMHRKVIAEALSQERQGLHKQMMRHLENLRSDFEFRMDAAAGRGGGARAPTAGRNLPSVIDSITWAIQAEEKLRSTQTTFEAVEGTMSSGAFGEQFDNMCKDLQRDINEFKKSQFADWQESVADRLSDIKLEKNEKLMDLDSKHGHVKLHYNSELVTLLREVRQLAALGFPIKRDVASEAETARKFYRHGMVLKQVANFYNDIGTQMIPCQKAMMLDDAREFERVLTNPKDGLGKTITWNNPTALEGYIQRLQTVANGLTDKNRRLRKWHRVLGEKVADMLNLDLVRQRERWGKAIKELREIFTNLEKEGFSAGSQATWRLHWDHQIYKVLECQYVRGLECLNETLPQMDVKLVFKQKRLQYEPPLEEIRTQHYKQIKAFLNLPLTHKGVSEQSEKAGFFRHMVDTNAVGVSRVYERAENLFVRLSEEQKKLADWVALGTVDLDEFCDEHLDEVMDWETNFRMLKQASKDVEKLATEVRIDCYMVSMLPAKTSIDEHLKTLQDSLVGSLRRKAQQERDEVESFINEGKGTLEAEATSVEEIGKARAGAKSLVGSIQRIMQMRRKVDEKNKLLRTVLGSNANQGVVDMTALANEWDNFTQKLQQHESHLDEQKNALKGQVEKRVKDFQQKVDTFAARWHELKPKGVPQGDPQLTVSKMEDDHRAYTELKEEADKIKTDCEHFSMDLPDFSILEEVGADIETTRGAWSKFGTFIAERKEIGERDWITFRKTIYHLEDFLAKWLDMVKGSAAKDTVSMLLLEEIDQYRKCLPFLKFVRGEGWERNHWMQLFGLLGLPTKGTDAVSVENLTVDHFLNVADKMVERADEIKHLHSQAQGEVTLREALHQLKVWGLERAFTLTDPDPSHKNSVPLIKEWKEIMTEVGDHQSLTQSLRESPFFGPFKEETAVWETRLSVLSESCLHLNAVQRKWVYLEPIFSKGALPQEQARFRRVDEEFRSIMMRVQSDPLVVSFSEIPRLRESLPAMGEQLDICQKALSDFLEEKRGQFPRFYFIGDDDLLEVLGQSKKPEVIQSHLKKLFAGIHSVVFGEGNGTIVSLKSMDGEVVPLDAPVAVNEHVETWLSNLSDAMKGTLGKQLSKCIQLKDYREFPSQILCIADMVHFCQKAEQSIQQGTLAQFREQLLAQLQEYTAFDVEGFRVMQLKIQSLVLDLIHNIDVVDQLISEGCAQITDWIWNKQMRYYMQAGSTACNVYMAEAIMEYSYEYQGNAPKLVYTPLTDKCYLTLTQGMQLGYGGNPYGPAGTGKTESVKALGQCLARQVLVFNCDEEFDFMSMGRIFMGLIKCGAWGCFDEFNRLEEDVLSAVSQQIQVIQQALKERQPQMEFLARTVTVNHQAGIFVTLNPAGKGYGGRSKLPDNLKQLFRAVAMTAPNFDLIAEVMLLSEGFQHAKDVGRKLVSLFALAKQLLSPQQHYDWGLRALKTVLGIAGKQLHEQRQSGGTITEENEYEIVIRSVRATTMPKLTHDDVGRFADLLRDVYPSIKVSDVSDEALVEAIKVVVAELGLELVPLQVEKVLQMHLACIQRIGVIIVGPSGSGKTTLWKILDGAYRKLGNPVVLHLMNPKATPRKQLLGHMDMDTREWFDGILTASARQVVKEEPEQHSWIICDGDVDPEWIESLNSVLDDNHLLTLPSGERIQFANNVNFIFECHELKYASPATVSRTGMIFLSEENVDTSIMMKSWIKKQPAETQSRLEGWINDYFYKAFDLALTKLPVVETTKAGVLSSGLSHLVGVDNKRDFCLKTARGFAANMDLERRNEFLNECTRFMNENDLLQLPAPQQLPGDFGGDGRSASGLVLVDDVKQCLATITPWLEAGEPMILVGPEGCGKSMIIQHALEQLKSTTVAVINCSAQTNALHCMQKLTQVCGAPVTSNEGRVLRPRDSERLVLYFKDLNLPKPDKYETIQLISFLQQLITFRGYYDENNEFIRLESNRVQIVTSMNPSNTVGRHALTTRFTAIVRIAYVGYPERSQLQTIYYNILRGVLENHPSYSSEAQLRKLAGSMLDIYDGIKQAFSPDDHRHYKFTPRNLTDWAMGLARYDLLAIDLMDALSYECARVFRDRLVGTESLQRFDGLVSSILRSQFRANTNAGALFSTWANVADGESDGVGHLVAVSQDSFHELVSGKMLMYEREQKELNIMLFPEVLQRLARFDRVLGAPGGHMLLCGRSGVGRRSALTLAAYMHRMEIFTPNMTRDYGLKQFRKDLKEVMVKCGVEGQATVLFMEDHQLVDTTFIEIINSILSGGEVPGLFTNEELDGLLAPLREEMSTAGFMHKNLFAFFTHRVKQYLHVVLSMDPGNPMFALRCEANPALYTRCSIQWVDMWSHEGLQMVPNMFLEEVFNESDEDYDEHIVDQMIAIQATVEGTARQYVSFINMYKAIFTKKRGEQLEQKKFLQAGLDKLGEAESKVDELSQSAGKQRALLAEKQAQAEQALQQITISMQKASESKIEVEALQKKLSEEEVDLKQRKQGIENELSEIQPLIDSAKKAVGSIKSDNINEIRSLKMPPDAIRDVLEGVLRLMGNQDTSWMNMRKFLGNRAVKEEIINFDARKIKPEIRAGVQKLLAAKGNSFEHQVIYRVSVAAAPLAAWVKANVKYSLVLERIAPLEQDLETLMQSLEESKSRLIKCEEDLRMLDDQVVKLKEDFAGRTREAEQLKFNLKSATDQLQAAESLLGKLGGEKGRWEEQVGFLDRELKSLPLNSLMSAGFITYLPHASEDSRRSFMNMWLKIGGQEEFTFKTFMSSESEMLTWKAEGLPSDDLSMENAIVILQTNMTPFIIDPSTQATEWLKSHLKLKGTNIESCTPLGQKFQTTLELAVRFGKTLIIEEVDNIEPVLYPLLRKDLLHQGPRLLVQIGDKQIDYNEQFNLYLVTRNPYPEIPPDAASLITETNFTVTRSGLEGQLLGLTIHHEQPELEEQKSALLKQEEDLKVQLAELERSLLKTLATSEGNILENTALIESLNETKVKSNTIKTSLEESATLQESLDKQRNVYRPIAEKGSLMFFLMRDLRTLNHMYQFSLSVFIRLFKKALATESTAASMEARIALLGATLLQSVFMYTSRSLYKADRLTFGMHFVRHLSPDMFQGASWDHFLGILVESMAGGGGGGVGDTSWVPQEALGHYAALTTALPMLNSEFDFQNVDQWREWISNAQCETRFPSTGRQTNGFHQLLVTQALRPDRLESAMNNFICTSLNVKSVSPPPTSLKQMYEKESSGNEPILFITTPGADPSQELEEFAEKSIGRQRYHQVAMGQGQSEVALNLLRECARTGDWLCLKNVHLVVMWLSTLEKEVYQLTPHPDFRLFLTSEPHHKFPSSLLEMCLKITFESPPGLKKNLLRTYESWSTQYISQGSPLRAQLLFLLAWFHAVVQERRTYVPQGWSKFYEFSFADLRSGADIIDLGCKDGRVPQWKYLHGLLENAIYGGRVDNRYDVSVLRTYLAEFFSSDVVGASGSRVKPVPGTKTMVLPQTAHHGDYMGLIGGLSETDDPTMFSMPANSARTVQQANSGRVVSQLKLMALTSEAGAGFNRERWTKQLGPILKLWDKLAAKCPIVRQPLNPREVMVNNMKNPVDVFMGMEYIHGRNLMTLIEKTLGGINRVLRGSEMLTPDVQKQAQQLLDTEVPTKWDSAWEGPEDPMQYCRSAVLRMQALEDLWHQAQGAGFVAGGSPIDLGHLYHPDTFLNALRQQTARELGESMDGLKLVSTWEGYNAGHSLTVQVRGLLVQGALFSGKTLSEVPSNGSTENAIPPANFMWIKKDQPPPYAHFIQVPLYATNERAKMICDMQLPLNGGEEANNWVLTGTAVFVSA